MLQVFAGSAAYPSDLPRPVLAIGNFDGLHLGHRHLIAKLVETARTLNAPAAVYTFDPPPRVVLSPDAHPPRIQTWPDKVRILGELGVDIMVVERFTRAFALHPPSWFIAEVLGSRIQPLAMVLGYDTRFGCQRKGNISTIRSAFPDMEITEVKALEINGKPVSSSKIRSLVGDGHVADAAKLLGCAHRIRGTVVAGKARGRTLGFPTANLRTDALLIPSRGVYAVRVQVERGPWHNGVANLGTRPTFDGHGFLIEVHLLDFSGDLYGNELCVEFIVRLRGEQQFEGAEALRTQIQLDIGLARTALAE
jgi:riboflavin kinase/FMN adenylyltransferase